MTKRPLKIGITGGIGSGKTLVSQIFNILGVPVYDADSRAKWLMSHHPEVVHHIKMLLGNDAYAENEKLDTKRIAAIVFADASKLAKLNAIVHPQVAKDFEAWTTSYVEEKYVLKEAALLFESGSYTSLDRIIVVSAPEQIRINRIRQRDTSRSIGQIHAIISRQMPEEEKLKMADDIILNDEKTMVIPQVLQIHKRYSD
jgi:dephospho-CoA kinase